MVRYRYTGSELLGTAQTTGGAVPSISNNGITVISSTAAETYVLAPPTVGCRKTLVFLAATSSGVTRSIELSSASSDDSITLVHTTGLATATQIDVVTTYAVVMEMVGLSATQWHLLYSKGAIADSTGIVFGAS